MLPRSLIPLNIPSHYSTPYKMITVSQKKSCCGRTVRSGCDESLPYQLTIFFYSDTEVIPAYYQRAWCCHIRYVLRQSSGSERREHVASERDFCNNSDLSRERIILTIFQNERLLKMRHRCHKIHTTRRNDYTQNISATSY